MGRVITNEGGVRETELMRRVEEKYKKPVGEVLIDLVDKGWTYEQIGNELGISKATVPWWMSKYKLTLVRTLLRPGEMVKRVSVHEQESQSSGKQTATAIR